jgi:hypothetical protein
LATELVRGHVILSSAHGVQSGDWGLFAALISAFLIAVSAAAGLVVLGVSVKRP